MAQIVDSGAISNTMWRLGFGNRFVHETPFCRLIANKTLTYVQFCDAMKLAAQNTRLQRSVVTATLEKFTRMGENLYEMLCVDCPSDRYEELVSLYSRFTP